MEGWNRERTENATEATALLSDDPVAELIPFSFSQKDGGEIKPAAFVYVPNLWQKIEHFLEQNDDKDRGYTYTF